MQSEPRSAHVHLQPEVRSAVQSHEDANPCATKRLVKVDSWRTAMSALPSIDQTTDEK
jgi:hypothetical protein